MGEAVRVAKSSLSILVSQMLFMAESCPDEIYDFGCNLFALSDVPHPDVRCSGLDWRYAKAHLE